MGLVFFSAMALSPQSFAGVYSFGDGCASLGSWSQQALIQTKNLISIIESLKNDKNCVGIESIIPKIKVAEDALTTAGDDQARTDRLESLPNELSALRSFVGATSEQRSEVLKLMAFKKLEAASLASEKVTGTGAAGAGAAGKAIGDVLGVGSVDPATLGIAVGVKKFSDRVDRSLNVGLSMLEQSLDVLPQLDRCLVKSPNQGVALLAAMVKMNAAFASSQSGTADRIANVTAKLVTFARNKSFSKVLRNLDETEFWMSLGCLLETTSQSYCAAHDAHKLLDYSLREAKPYFNAKKETLDMENPLAGYYIISRDIPRIATWIQKIRFGIEPKLASDAGFKNKVWTDVTNLMKSINYLRGVYNEESFTFSTLTDLESKKSSVLKLVMKLNNDITRGGDIEGAGASGTNFFTQGVVPMLIPYRLVGIDIPEFCKSNSTRPALEFGECMVQNGDWNPIFQNPERLLQTIGVSLDNIIKSAVDRASLYFQQRMIVDKPNLVSESVTSQVFTVTASLRRVSSYLTALEKKILDLTRATDDENVAESMTLLPNIIDTNNRVKAVLNSYKTIYDVIGRGANTTNLADKDLQEAYDKVINAVCDKFNVITQWDTFLSTRMATFIHHDYALRIRNNIDMVPYEKELLIETGNELLYRLMSTTATSPTHVKNDIQAAIVINKRNLTSIETMFKQNLREIIGQLSYVIEGVGRSGKAPTWANAYRDNRNYARDQYSGNFFARSYGYLWAFSSTLGDKFSYLPYLRNQIYSPLYKFQPKNEALRLAAEDEFGAFKQLKARYCALSLGFEDRNYFYDLCKGTVLKSAYEVPPNSEKDAVALDLKYDRYMNANTKDKAVSGDSVCAFNTYGRRNLVYWMSLDMNNRK